MVINYKWEFMRSNIFFIATSELSQDAFFTWLLQWGDNSNAKLNKELYAIHSGVTGGIGNGFVGAHRSDPKIYEKL